MPEVKNKKPRKTFTAPVEERWFYLDAEVAKMYGLCISSFRKNLKSTPDVFPKYMMLGNVRIFPKEQPMFVNIIKPE